MIIKKVIPGFAFFFVVSTFEAPTFEWGELHWLKYLAEALSGLICFHLLGLLGRADLWCAPSTCWLCLAARPWHLRRGRSLPSPRAVATSLVATAQQSESPPPWTIPQLGRRHQQRRHLIAVLNLSAAPHPPAC